MRRLLPVLLLPALLAMDRHEPDNTRASAAADPAISHIVGQGPKALDHLVAEPGGEDWFHLYADCCSDVGAEIRWPAGRGQLELELVDAAGRAIARNDPSVTVSGSAGRRRIVVTGTGGDWFVHVRNPGRHGVSYGLRVMAPVYVN